MSHIRSFINLPAISEKPWGVSTRLLKVSLQPHTRTRGCTPPAYVTSLIEINSEELWIKDLLKHGLNFLSLKCCSHKTNRSNLSAISPRAPCIFATALDPPAEVLTGTSCSKRSRCQPRRCLKKSAVTHLHGSEYMIPPSISCFFSPPSSSANRRTWPCDLWRSVIGSEQSCCRLPTFMDFFHSCILKLLAWLLSNH